MLKRFCCLFGLIIVAAAAIPNISSATEIIEFDGPIGSIFPGNPTVEDGFVYDAISGALFRQFEGNPDLSIQGRTSQGGGILGIENVKNIPFTFDQIDVAKNTGGAALIVVEGYRNNVLQATDQFTTSANDFEFLTFSSVNLSQVLIDELRIELDAGTMMTPIETIDNVHLTPDSDAPVTVAAESLAVMPGIINAGGLPELGESDNADLSLFRDSNGVSAVTQFVVTGTSPTVTPSALEFTLEGNVVSRPNVVQRIELWDYVLGTWETVDEQDANRTPNPDKIVTVAPTGDLSRFVDQTTNEMMARIRYRADIARAQFASNSDLVIWSITQ